MRRHSVCEGGRTRAKATEVELRFTAQRDSTIVTITETGYMGDSHEVTAKVIDSTGGFTQVLAGLKALLEHGIELGLVRDSHPPR